jgi:hypothetical protein
MTNENQKSEAPTRDVQSGLSSASLLGVCEQLDILKMARDRLRNMERDYRKSADEYHKLGAPETARVRCEKADTLNEAVNVILAVECKYTNAKNATYA